MKAAFIELKVSVRYLKLSFPETELKNSGVVTKERERLSELNKYVRVKEINCLIQIVSRLYYGEIIS